MTASFKPTHHPCCNTLYRYAAGHLSPAMHLLVSAHLDYCPLCRQELQTYESQAGLGLEALPPETLDVKCLENLLQKIDESGPPACIDVTIPVCTIAQHRYPDVLRVFVGTSGENIKWDYRSGHAEWLLPLNATTRLLCLDNNQDMTVIVFEKMSLVLVLDGFLDAGKQRFQRGDIIRASALRNAGSRTSGETLCLVVVPQKQDKPNVWQCLMSFIFGDKN